MAQKGPENALLSARPRPLIRASAKPSQGFVEQFHAESAIIPETPVDGLTGRFTIHAEEREMFKEFKEFATKGSVIDMAVGIIIGAAFSPIVKSLVDNIIMPPVGLLLGNADFSNLYMIIKEGSTPGPYTSPAAAQEAGAVIIGYGLFINTIINFVIVAFAIFLLIRGVNRMRRQQEKPPAEPTTKACPQCLMEVPLKASRCGHCTSTLAP